MIHTLKMALCTMLLIASSQCAAGLGSMIDKLTGTGISTLHIQLIDTTQSITDVDKVLYRTTALNELSSVKAGDRIVIARISDASLGSFVVAADVTLPKSGRHFDDLAAGRKVKEQAVAAVNMILTSKSDGSKTRILDVFTALAPLIAEARAKQVTVRIVALTDAVEESSDFNMARQLITDSVVQREIRVRQKQGLLPDLSKVDVYFVGGSGPTPAASKAIESFWRNYISAGKGTVVFYGRTMPEFK